MSTFAFMIHRIGPEKNVARKFPTLGRLPRGIIDTFCHFFPPVYLCPVVGVRREAARKVIEGWLVACPLTPKTMLEVPVSSVHNIPIQTGHLPERRDAHTPSLDPFASAIGNAGVILSKRLTVPITTGNRYTRAAAVAVALGLMSAFRPTRLLPAWQRP
jgi:predicted amino acid dehydrogenase